jgi:hypothetical protein
MYFGYTGPFVRDRGDGAEADNSSPSRSKVKNGETVHVSPAVRLRVVVANSLGTGISLPLLK